MPRIVGFGHGGICVNDVALMADFCSEFIQNTTKARGNEIGDIEERIRAGRRAAGLEF